MSADWFRKQSWSAADEAEFNVRLLRARPSSRSQYLRVQGATLLEAGNPRSAAKLFDRVLAEYPDGFDFKTALWERGQCFEALDDFREARSFYRRAIYEKGWPNVHTNAWLDFAWLVARHRMMEDYEAAFGLLDQFGDKGLGLPVEVFRVMGSRAFMLSDRGETERAADCARAALRAASKRVSGFSRHPKIGLVGEIEPGIFDRLTAVACKTVA